SSYLYLIFNILIIALGVEAGLLSVFSEPSEDKKQHVSVSVTQKQTQKHAMLEQKEKEVCNMINNACFVSEEQNEKKPKVVEKSSSEKIVFVGVSKLDKVKKSPSMPSIFFIDDGEDDLEVNKDEEIEVEDEICGVNGQELFAKAEAFIGNFYKQLKMQREECCA
ncbi:hypothetical protein A2U01_0034191, partial [Trifolium medium]|nr:hypothetical protein [Trifolium medium]